MRQIYSCLIVKTSAIGDVIQTFPVLEYLRKRFPHARIDWAVEASCRPLLASHPLLNAVLSIDTKQWRKKPFAKETWSAIKAFKKRLRQTPYDLLFDLQGNTKSACITHLARAQEKVGFGRQSVAEKPNLLATNKRIEIPKTFSARQKYLYLVQTYFEDAESFATKSVRLSLSEKEQQILDILRHPYLENTPLFMVAFGSKWKNKQLPEKTWKDFLHLLQEKLNPSFLFVYGSEEEKQTAQRLQSFFPAQSLFLGNLTLPLWQNLMSEVDGLLAVDSAGLHLCATTPTPTFSIFGPSSAAIYKPFGEQHVAIQGACPYGKVFEKRCPILRTCTSGACIHSLTAEQLFERFMQWYTQTR